jgi:hypothetical protein
MGVVWKMSSGLIPNNRSCFGYLVASAVKHTPEAKSCKSLYVTSKTEKIRADTAQTFRLATAPAEHKIKGKQD